jgi:hypothetical protein
VGAGLAAGPPSPAAEGKTVFISAYRNFSVRYLLYSDIFKQLRASGLRIVVLLKDGDVEFYRERLAAPEVVVEPVLYDRAMAVLKGNALNRLFVLIRKCMSGGEPGFENSTDQVRLFMYEREMSVNAFQHLQFRLVRLVARAGTRSRAVRRLVLALEERLFPGRFYDACFEKYRPSVLVVSSVGYMIDPFLMRAARRHGCTVVSVIHSWDNPTTKDYRGAEPDHVITWNPMMKREVNVFHDVPEERIHVAGVAHWDHYFDGTVGVPERGAFLRSLGLDPGRRTLFYGTSSPILFRNTFDVIERLMAEVAAGGLGDVQLLVRLHPMYLLRRRGQEGQIVEQYRQRMDDLRARYAARLVFNLPMMRVLHDDIDMPPEDMHHLAAMLRHCDVLLTEYSTLMIEGAIFDRPIVNVALYNFRDTDRPAAYLENYTHIKRMLATGASRNAYTFEELLRYIREYLEQPGRDAEGRRALVDQEVAVNRGCAGRRVAELLEGLTQRR